MGYTETSLQEHVTSDHAETSTEVVGEASGENDGRVPPDGAERGAAAVHLLLSVMNLLSSDASYLRQQM